MFVPACFWLLFFVNIQFITNSETKTAFRIESFNDIVQNITHINSVLQEFIKNYRQLQDIYKSVELTAKDDVSEYVKRNKEAKYQDPTTTTITTTSVLPTITPLFYSEEHHWRDTYDENYYFDTTQPKKNLTRQQYKLNIKQRIKPAITTTRSTTRLTTKTTTKAQTTTTTEPTTKPIHVFSDASNESKETNELNDSTDIENAIKYNFHRPKTNRVIQSHETKELHADVRKVIKYETFDDDMWQSIIESRPIRYEYPDKPNLKRRSGGDSKKTAIVFLTNSKTYENTNKVNQFRNLLDTIRDDPIDENVLTPNMEMERTILRAKGKFGKACFRYVVRRCFLALDEALKKMCKEFGCKKNFKNTIKDTAKESCQNEFYGQIGENETTTTTTKIPMVEISAATTEKDKTRRFIRRKHQHTHHEHDDDLPGLGNNYLSTCYPHMLSRSARKQIESAELPDTFLKAIASAELPNHSHEKGILRDKYERACQKESAKRCKKAGKKTITVACDKFPSECKKRSKNGFKKQMSKMCMEAFGVKKKQIFDSYEDSCSSETSESSDSDPFSE